MQFHRCSSVKESSGLSNRSRPSGFVCQATTNRHRNLLRLYPWAASLLHRLVCLLWQSNSLCNRCAIRRSPIAAVHCRSCWIYWNNYVNSLCKENKSKKQKELRRWTPKCNLWHLGIYIWILTSRSSHWIVVTNYWSLILLIVSSSFQLDEVRSSLLQHMAWTFL